MSSEVKSVWVGTRILLFILLLFFIVSFISLFMFNPVYSGWSYITNALRYQSTLRSVVTCIADTYFLLFGSLAYLVVIFLIFIHLVLAFQRTRIGFSWLSWISFMAGTAVLTFGGGIIYDAIFSSDVLLFGMYQNGGFSSLLVNYLTGSIGIKLLIGFLFLVLGFITVVTSLIYKVTRGFLSFLSGSDLSAVDLSEFERNAVKSAILAEAIQKQREALERGVNEGLKVYFLPSGNEVNPYQQVEQEFKHLRSLVLEYRSLKNPTAAQLQTRMILERKLELQYEHYQKVFSKLADQSIWFTLKKEFGRLFRRNTGAMESLISVNHAPVRNIVGSEDYLVADNNLGNLESAELDISINQLDQEVPELSIVEDLSADLSDLEQVQVEVAPELSDLDLAVANLEADALNDLGNISAVDEVPEIDSEIHLVDPQAEALAKQLAEQEEKRKAQQERYAQIQREREEKERKEAEHREELARRVAAERAAEAERQAAEAKAREEARLKAEEEYRRRKEEAERQAAAEQATKEQAALAAAQAEQKAQAEQSISEPKATEEDLLDDLSALEQISVQNDQAPAVVATPETVLQASATPAASGTTAPADAEEMSDEEYEEIVDAAQTFLDTLERARIEEREQLLEERDLAVMDQSIQPVAKPNIDKDALLSQVFKSDIEADEENKGKRIQVQGGLSHMQHGLFNTPEAEQAAIKRAEYEAQLKLKREADARLQAETLRQAELARQRARVLEEKQKALIEEARQKALEEARQRALAAAQQARLQQQAQAQAPEPVEQAVVAPQAAPVVHETPATPEPVVAVQAPEPVAQEAAPATVQPETPEPAVNPLLQGVGMSGGVRGGKRRDKPTPTVALNDFTSIVEGEDSAPDLVKQIFQGGSGIPTLPPKRKVNPEAEVLLGDTDFKR